MEIVISSSTNENKKYGAVIDGKKKTSFGASGYSDFTKHKNTDRKDRYIDRHTKNEDWTKSVAKAAGFYSKHVLWNKPTLKASIDDINKTFKHLNVKIKYTYNLNIYRVMDKLPIEVIRNIYEYDPTYNIKFDKVLNQLSAHIYIYRCSECFKELNKCFCYCKICRTYLRFCHQIFYDKDSVYEDDLNDIIQMGV